MKYMLKNINKIQENQASNLYSVKFMPFLSWFYFIVFYFTDI